MGASNEAITMKWVNWFNQGTFEHPERFYAPDVDMQRMGMQAPMIGRDSVVDFLRDEAFACAGRKLQVLEMASQDDGVALEADCYGFDPEAQLFDSPRIRLGPILIFLTIRDGLIVQDHTYMAAPLHRVTPVGIDEIRWEKSRIPMPGLLQLWELTYNTDPDAMMLQTYTRDGTVTAMRTGARPWHLEEQIALERRSWERFPGHKDVMRRWITTPNVIAVEFTWEARYYRRPEQLLKTISACYLRLRDGLVWVDHSYIPTAGDHQSPELAATVNATHRTRTTA